MIVRTGTDAAFDDAVDAALDDAPRFTFATFLRDRAVQLVLAFVCMLAVYAACFLQGVGMEGSLLVALVVFTCIVAALAFEFGRKRAFYRALAAATTDLSDACVATSLVEEPEFLEGQMAFEAVAALSGVAGRQITAAERNAVEYRRYVEAWIHEVKTPIAAAKLVLSGMHGEDADKLAREVERIEGQVESALFYARSSFLAGDYAIGRTALAGVCREACKRNSRFLIAAGCTPVVDVSDSATVLSDRQWVAFLLSQVVVNAAKYGATRVTFSSHVEEADTPREHTVLEVADDGIGIPASDVARVFDMGFVGRNGRERGKATGLGLYLVARLSEAMGIDVAIASEEGVGTRVMFRFPHDMRRLQAMQQDALECSSVGRAASASACGEASVGNLSGM